MSYDPNSFPAGGDAAESADMSRVHPLVREMAELDPRVERLVGDIQRLGSKPGLLEAVLNRTADESLMSDPGIQESIRQYSAGDYSEFELSELEVPED